MRSVFRKKETNKIIRFSSERLLSLSQDETNQFLDKITRKVRHHVEDLKKKSGNINAVDVHKRIYSHILRKIKNHEELNSVELELLNAMFDLGKKAYISFYSLASFLGDPNMRKYIARLESDGYTFIERVGYIKVKFN